MTPTQGRTGWEDGLERDHSEVYTYTAGDRDMLVIRVNEVLFDEPDEDYSPGDPEHWKIDKQYSTWRGECRLHGDPREEEIQELLQLGQSVRTDPDDRRREANVAFVYAEVAIASPDDVILELLCKIPQLTWQGAVWQGWTRSYQRTAGKVEAPVWI